MYGRVIGFDGLQPIVQRDDGRILTCDYICGLEDQYKLHVPMYVDTFPSHSGNKEFHIACPFPAMVFRNG